jgi:hypothetical protein
MSVVDVTPGLRLKSSTRSTSDLYRVNLDPGWSHCALGDVVADTARQWSMNAAVYGPAVLVALSLAAAID